MSDENRFLAIFGASGSGGGGGSSSGIFGISNSSGEYTYYATIELALAGASSGDVIEQFANVTVSTSTTVTLVDGVDWNMNGYLFENNYNAGNVECVSLPSNATVYIYNGEIKRSGGTNNAVGNTALYHQNGTNSKLYLNGVTINCTTSTTSYGKASIFGGNFIGGGTSFGVLINQGGEINNAQFNTTYGLSLFSGSTARNCVSYSSLGVGIGLNNGYLYSSVGTSVSSDGISAGQQKNIIYNCTGNSASGFGIKAEGTSTTFTRLKNSSGYSESSYGLYLGQHVKATKTDGFSDSNFGGYVLGDPIIIDCTFTSIGSVGIKSVNDATFDKCTFISYYDNASGHAFTTLNSTTNGIFLMGCTFITKNASANGISSSGAGINISWSGSDFKGMTTAVSTTNGNQMVNTSDAYGNTLIT